MRVERLHSLSVAFQEVSAKGLTLRPFPAQLCVRWSVRAALLCLRPCSEPHRGQCGDKSGLSVVSPTGQEGPGGIEPLA